MCPLRKKKSKALHMLPIVVGFGPGTNGLGCRWEHQSIQFNFVHADAGQGREMMAVSLSL